jgi:transposase
MLKSPENLPNSQKELKEIILDLQLELSSYKQKITASELELSSYKQKYEQLIEQLRLAKLQRFAPSSEKNIFQADLFDEIGIELPEENENGHTETEVKSYKRKKTVSRRPLPKDLPREVIEHDIPAEEKTCDCGSPLSRIGQEITEQLKYIPPKLWVLQHIRHKYACKPCQENVKIAAMPMLLLPKSIATPELIAYTAVSKFSDHLPLYRQSAIWQRFDIDISRSNLCSWLMKTAEIINPLPKLLHKNLINDNYIQGDESTLQVLNEPGRPNKTKSYLWVYKGGPLNKPCVVFDYQETRGGYHAENFLKDFKGFLQTDAYSGYNFVENYEDITSIGCFAHARRPFAELAKISKKTGLAMEAIAYIRELYAIEKHARENNFTIEQRYELRDEKAPPILDAFRAWLEKNINKVPKQHKMGQGMQYCLRHWAELTNYLKHGRIEIDNNAVENLIRKLALGRKNFLFAGSPAGARAAATYYSLMGTCELNGIEPYKYFCAMLHQIRLCKIESDYQNLLPYSIQL